MGLQSLFVVFVCDFAAGNCAKGVHFEESAHCDERDIGHFVCCKAKTALIKLSSVLAGLFHEEGQGVCRGGGKYRQSPFFR